MTTRKVNKVSRYFGKRLFEKTGAGNPEDPFNSSKKHEMFFENLG